MQTATMPAPKSVRTIPATIDIQSIIHQSHRRLRVAAYCRVSTKQEEQLNSYEVQKKYYEDRIRTEPKWSLVGIFADTGITGTSMKKRDEFNKMLRLCRKGKIDMIIVKSISRFARNTLDCIAITRRLRKIGVDAERLTADAHGRLEGRKKSYGDALTAWITARSTATVHRVWKKAYCKTPL